MRDMTKKIRWLYIAVFFAASYILFFDNATRFLHPLLWGICVVSVTLHMGKMRFTFARRREMLLFLLTCVCVAFSIFGAPLFIDNTEALSESLLLFLTGFVWSVFLVKTVIDGFEWVSSRKTAEHSSHYWHKWLLLFFLLLPGFFLYMRAYNPVVISPDSVDYAGGWLKGEYDAFRSPVYQLLINLVCTLAPTEPALMWVPVAQSIAFAAVFSTWLMLFHQRWISLLPICVIALLLPLIPSVGLHAIVIWSDGPFSISLLWLVYVLARVFKDEENGGGALTGRQQASLLIQLCISLSLVFFLRSNSFLVYLVLAPALCILFIHRKDYKRLLSVGVSILIVLIIRFPVYAAIGVEDNTEQHNTREVKYYAGIHDMQAAYYQEGKLSEKTAALLRRSVPDLDGEAKDTFDPIWSNYRFYDLSELEVKEFLAMYMDALWHNPGEVIRSVLTRTRHFWSIDAASRVNCVNYTSIYDGETRQYGDQSVPLGLYRQRNALTRMMDGFLASMNTSLPATFIWRFGFWLSLMVCTALYAVLRRKPIHLILFLPVLAYLATIFLTSAWTDYRYGLSIFFVGLFVPAYIVLDSRGGARQEERELHA